VTRLIRRSLALAALVMFPATALAAPPPPPHPVAPPPRQAMPSHPISPPRPVTRPPVQPPRTGGFGFPHNEVNGAHVQPYVRIPYPNEPRYTGGPYRGWHGPPIPNPHHWNHWGWNHGVIWYPAPLYWGWGFWGPWAIGASTGVVLYGAFVDYSNQVIYPSYEIEASSPGAQLLQNYNLQQTPCGPPNLVVIWGPGNSVICAYPNDLVAAGNYQLDPATLTLQSLSTPPQSP
jgi:hypothetical protein